MPISVQKIMLSQSRDIPFNRLVLSQSNVRRIEELAQDIARRTPPSEPHRAAGF
jgi:hypothetical protein